MGSASWTKSLEEIQGKLDSLCRTAPDFYFVYKGRQNLFLSGSGQLPSSFLQTSAPGSQIKPAIFVWLFVALV